MTKPCLKKFSKQYGMPQRKVIVIDLKLLSKRKVCQ